MDLADHVHRLLTSTVVAAGLGLSAAGCGRGGDGGTEGAASDGAKPVAAAPTYRVRVHFSRDEEIASVPRRGRVPERPTWAAFAALLAGPDAAERDTGLHSFFSDSTAGTLRGVARRGDTLVVELGDLQRVIPGAGSSAGSRALLDALHATAFQFPEVEAVLYRMEGSCRRFWHWLQRECRVVTRPGPDQSPPSSPRFRSRAASTRSSAASRPRHPSTSVSFPSRSL